MMCDENLTVIRFRELVDKEKSRESIAKKMTEQGLNCNTSTITKHYNGDRTISTEYVIKYAKYFGVSTDYLLGLSDVASTDTNTKMINEYTGLSEKAIDVLHFYRSCEKIYPTINALLETEMSSVLQELGYQLQHFPDEIIEEECKKKGVDSKEVIKIIELGEYECLQVVSKIEKYLNIKVEEDSMIEITKSGKLINITEDMKNKVVRRITNIDDALPVYFINQKEIIEKVLLDEVMKNIEMIKLQISE